MRPWLERIAPVTVEVECGGSTHTVSWRRGKLVLHDHRLGDEAVFAALGAERPPCLSVLAEWRDRARWAAATRPPPPGFVRRVVPPAVPDALAEVRRYGVVRAWERRWRRNGAVEEAEDLYRILRRRALPAITESLQAARVRLGGGRANFVELRLARPDGSPEAEGRIDRHRSALVVTLGPAWIYEVGAPGDLLRGEAFVVAPGKVVTWEVVSPGDNSWRPVIVDVPPADT